MPLLDGKYEIHAERELGDGITRFDATDPDGRPVRVEWVEVAGGDEVAFERYRRLLKRLAREGRAALHDVVGRPGAHYVAWTPAPPGALRAPDPDLDAAIAAAGFDPAHAELRRYEGGVKLVALPFRPGAPAVTAPPPAEHDRAPRRPLAWPWRAWIWSLALLATATAVAGATFLRTSNDRVVLVPDLEGRAYAEAAGALSRLGLGVEIVVVASDEAAAGTVLESDPAANAALRPGRSVRLSVALPPGSVAPTSVPRLVGVDRDDLVPRLTTAGLRLGMVVEVHAPAPDGVVLAQRPPAATTVGEGSPVDVVVSRGPQPEVTSVPDLVGRPLADARWLASLAGLAADQVVVERLPVERVAVDTVLSQSLPPFHEVPRASAVLRLVVADPASPSTPVGLPALGGLDEARARAMAAGFEVQVAYVGELGLPDGVVAQSLPVGATPADGPLVLTINARPVAIPLPDADVTVRAPEPRRLAYLWFVEPGIPPVLAEVTATTLEGDVVRVARRVVQGGQRVEGTWATSYPGVVEFRLTLNGEPYGDALRVQ